MSVCSSDILVKNAAEKYTTFRCGTSSRPGTYSLTPTAILVDDLSSTTLDASPVETTQTLGPSTTRSVQTSAGTEDQVTSDSKPGSLNTGAVVGGVVGGVAIICLTILAIFWMRRRHRDYRAPPEKGPNHGVSEGSQPSRTSMLQLPEHSTSDSGWTSPHRNPQRLSELSALNQRSDQ